MELQSEEQLTHVTIMPLLNISAIENKKCNKTKKKHYNTVSKECTDLMRQIRNEFKFFRDTGQLLNDYHL